MSTTAPEKPILIFCPGAWCLPSLLDPITGPLTAAGFTCETVLLPSVFTSSSSSPSPSTTTTPTTTTTTTTTTTKTTPQTGLQADAAAVRATILPHLDAGHDVILIAHSYGGVVASEAVRDLDRATRGSSTGAVIYLIYIAAILLDLGATVWPSIPDDVIIQDEICWQDPTYPGSEGWVACCDDAQRGFIAANVRPHAWRCFKDPVTFTGWRRIRGMYVRARRDLMPDVMVNAPRGHLFDVVVEIEGDHFVVVGNAGEVVRVITEAVERVMVEGR